MKELMLALHQKPVAYYPIYKSITGSTTAGILLSQLMYWWQKVGGREFYKTDAEIIEETHLSAQELKTAKKALKECDFIHIKARGVPAKTYYDVNSELLIQAIQKGEINQTRRVKSTKLKSINQPNSAGEINQTITENTHKNTSENTTIFFSIEKNPSPKITESDIEHFESQLNTQIEKEEVPAVNVTTSKKKQTRKPKSQKILFADTEYCTEPDGFQRFEAAMIARNEKYKNYDLDYYYQAVQIWSEKGNAAVNWIATAAGFILRDEGDRKAKMSKSIKNATTNQVGNITTGQVHGEAKNLTEEIFRRIRRG